MSTTLTFPSDRDARGISATPVYIDRALTILAPIRDATSGVPIAGSVLVAASTGLLPRFTLDDPTGASGGAVYCRNPAGGTRVLDTVDIRGGDQGGQDLGAYSGDLLTSGEEVFPRTQAAGSTVTAASQRLHLGYFTARKTETITQLLSYTGSTAAGATPTLCRMGLYSVAANGDLTLVASTPNDATLWAAPTTGYTKALSASYKKVAGQRYAFGLLCVSGAAIPTWASAVFAASGPALLAPVLCGAVTGQADLPSTIASASVVAATTRVFGILLP